MIPVDLQYEGNWTNGTDSSPILGKDNTNKGQNIESLQIYKSDEMSVARVPPILLPRYAHAYREISSGMIWLPSMLLQNGFQVWLNFLQAAGFILPVGPRAFISETLLLWSKYFFL